MSVCTGVPGKVTPMRKRRMEIKDAQPASRAAKSWARALLVGAAKLRTGARLRVVGEGAAGGE